MPSRKLTKDGRDRISTQPAKMSMELVELTADVVTMILIKLTYLVPDMV